MFIRTASNVAALAAFVLLAASTAALADSGPPGDIPDNQAYVVYHGAGYLLKVPEGWGRQGAGRSVTFADKYNSIRVDLSSARQAPSVMSVRRSELASLKAQTKGFVHPRLSGVRRLAGAAILVTYGATSARNPVTGKTIATQVQRYEFWRHGRLCALTLQAPAGSDNVDPYRVITNSFRWT